MTTELPDTHDSTPAPVPLALKSNEGLGPLPEADGTAEANKERHPEGGYTFDQIPAWSEALVRAYAADQVAAERERFAQLAKAAADVVRVWESPSWNWSHTGSAADAMNALAACLRA